MKCNSKCSLLAPHNKNVLDYPCRSQEADDNIVVPHWSASPGVPILPHDCEVILRPQMTHVLQNYHIDNSDDWLYSL